MSFTNRGFPFQAPPGTYPPTTVVWRATLVTVPAGQPIFVVPWGPATAVGVLNVVPWYVTDIFFRLENAGSTQSTLQIQRYTGTGAFVASNNINDTAIVIPANAHEPAIRPVTPSVLNHPSCNSGDKLMAVFTLGTGASIVEMLVTLSQVPQL
jgi:hypothetical protein